MERDGHPTLDAADGVLSDVLPDDWIRHNGKLHRDTGTWSQELYSKGPDGREVLFEDQGHHG